jgi:hypothetical protein
LFNLLQKNEDFLERYKLMEDITIGF